MPLRCGTHELRKVSSGHGRVRVSWTRSEVSHGIARETQKIHTDVFPTQQTSVQVYRLDWRVAS
jgi:hypothetical protein